MKHHKRGPKASKPPPPDGKPFDISIQNRDLYHEVKLVHVPGRSNKWTPERTPETLAILANNTHACLEHLKEAGVPKIYLVNYAPIFCRDQIVSVITKHWKRDWGSDDGNGNYITYAAEADVV